MKKYTFLIVPNDAPQIYNKGTIINHMERLDEFYDTFKYYHIDGINESRFLNFKKAFESGQSIVQSHSWDWPFSIYIVRRLTNGLGWKIVSDKVDKGW